MGEGAAQELAAETGVGADADRKSIIPVFFCDFRVDSSVGCCGCSRYFFVHKFVDPCGSKFRDRLIPALAPMLNNFSATHCCATQSPLRHYLDPQGTLPWPNGLLSACCERVNGALLWPRICLTEFESASQQRERPNRIKLLLLPVLLLVYTSRAAATSRCPLLRISPPPRPRHDVQTHQTHLQLLLPAS